MAQSSKRKMLAIFVLSLLIFTQTTLASSSDDDWLDLRDLFHLLEPAKKTASEPQCAPANLGLIIDSSRSIWEPHFHKGLEFLVNLTDKFDIGPGEDQDRVAAVSFAEVVYTVDGFDFVTYNTTEEVKRHLKSMPFRAGESTKTDKAIRYMRELQIQQGSSGKRQLQLLLTDGKSDNAEATETEAMETKRANITVIAVGVGENVNREELLKISGGVDDHVFQAASYDYLDKNLIERIILKFCKPCGEKFPADINFVFSPAVMGLNRTATVTSFINNVITHRQLTAGFRYGVVSGDCPDDEGFTLNQYNSPGAIRQRLERYDRNNLPYIVQRATETRFTIENGARVNAKKVAVIFLGNYKVDKNQLRKAIKNMVKSNIKVFVYVPYKKLPQTLTLGWPDEVTYLLNGPLSRVTQLVNHLCPDA